MYLGELTCTQCKKGTETAVRILMERERGAFWAVDRKLRVGYAS